MNPFDIFRYLPLPILRLAAKGVAQAIIHMPEVSMRRNIDINLALVYPELTGNDKKKLTRSIIQNQCLTLAEFLKCWAMPTDWSVQQIKQVHNHDILDKALKDPNGLLVVVPHLGTWEMMNAWFSQFGEAAIMYKPFDSNLLNDFVLSARSRLNAKLVPTDASGVKQIFKTLKQAGFSIVLPDHVPAKSSGINAPFFGISTLTSTLTPKLASKTKCALVGLTCIRREEGNGFDIYCYDLDDAALYSKDIDESTTALNKAIETMIEPHTEHYQWNYRRFKNVPIIKNPYKQSWNTINTFLSKRFA